MKTKLENLLKTYPSFRWVCIGWMLFFTLAIPARIILKIPFVGPFAALALLIFALVFSVVFCINARRIEKKGQEPTALMKLIYRFSDLSTALVSNPKETIKSSIQEIKEAEGTEKVKKIVFAVLSVIYIIVAIRFAIVLVVLMLSLLFLLPYFGIGGDGLVYCPHCGALVDPVDLYCGTCGNPIQ